MSAAGFFPSRSNTAGGPTEPIEKGCGRRRDFAPPDACPDGGGTRRGVLPVSGSFGYALRPAHQASAPTPTPPPGACQGWDPRKHLPIRVFVPGAFPYSPPGGAGLAPGIFSRLGRRSRLSSLWWCGATALGVWYSSSRRPPRWGLIEENSDVAAFSYPRAPRPGRGGAAPGSFY